MTLRDLVVLAGGLTHERDVSLRSGSRLAQALRQAGHTVEIRDADAGLLPWLHEHRPDAAVVALHGGRGENGAVQALLEMAGVPFVGTGSHECRLAWDKATAKVLLRRAGYSTPEWLTLSHSAFRDLGAQEMIAAVLSRLSLPLILKPHQGGSALGTTLVTEAGELPAALVNSFAYGEVVLIERFVEGTEIAVTVVETIHSSTGHTTGHQDSIDQSVGTDRPVALALPAVEICPPGAVFDYEARYTAGTTTYHTPARLSDENAAAAADLALTAHRVLGLRDLSRMDAIVSADGTVQFLEVNVSPGLTETSMLPMAVAAQGLELGAVYSDLIENAISRG
jgi:D-alanine-D-alanine ligase